MISVPLSTQVYVQFFFRSLPVVFWAFVLGFLVSEETTFRPKIVPKMTCCYFFEQNFDRKIVIQVTTTEY